MKDIDPHRFYVVDYTDVNRPFYARRSFPSYRKAREIIAYYLDGYYTVVKGDILSLLDIPRGSLKLPAQSPLEKPKKIREIEKEINMKRIEGIDLNKFKALRAPVRSSRVKGPSPLSLKAMLKKGN